MDGANILALNQTLFKKHLVIGKGFTGKEKKSAEETFRGWDAFVNGITIIPDYGEIEQIWHVGSFYYPDLMSGMPPAGGVVSYELAETKGEYLLIAGVKLDEEESTDEEERAIAAFISKNRIYGENLNLGDVTEDLLMAHFKVFIGDDEINEMVNSFEFQEPNKIFLEKVVNEYVLKISQLKKSLEQPSAEKQTKEK